MCQYDVTVGITRSEVISSPFLSIFFFSFSFFSFFSLSVSYFSIPLSRSFSSPAVFCKVQIAVGSPGFQQGGSDSSGQRRASIGSSRLRRAAPDLQIAVGSAGPQPGSSRAKGAAPDLTSQKICQKIYQKKVRQKCQKKCQKKYQMICQ